MKKILVIDDDLDILEVVSMLLTMNGFDVHTYSTGYNVPEVISKFDPELVLLDINLPGKSGTEICKEMKAISNQPPILLFSAHAKENDVAKACQADGFIGKPFEVKNLIQTINSLAN